MVNMQNDANWLVIRIPRMYADHVTGISLGRIIGTAIDVQVALYEGEKDVTSQEWDNTLAAFEMSQEELTTIKNAVDAFSSAVREALLLEFDIMKDITDEKSNTGGTGGTAS